MTRVRGPLPRAAILGVLAALSLLTGCGSSSSRDVVLRFWAMGREGEVVAQLLPEFERANPDITVKVQQLPWTAAHEKLLTAFAGDATPDVCQLGNTWLPEFVALKALAPLDRHVAASAIVHADDYFAGIWDTNRVDGTLYGVPWYVDTRLLFYRRDLLAQAGFSAPPRSWQEWREMLVAVQRSAGPDRFPILLPLNEFEPLLALALQQDEPLLRDGGRWGNFSAPGFRRALGFYLEMFERGWAPAVASAAIANVWIEFGRGRFAFYVSGPWNIGELRRRLPADQQERWMTAPLPGPDGPGVSIAGGSSLVVFRASRHQAEAWRLVEFLSQPAIQRRFHTLTGDLPPRRATWQDPGLAGDVQARAFREQLERVEPAPKVPEWERIANEMRLVAERAVHGELSVDQAVRELDARADRILEKRRWLLARRGAG
ncbi:MAG TPA: sugar ABC transporter substrate-binding protein [Methylomirabilota bacterium]|nr:sugar ABC transporter substrate-binding protein [Methylomirabilota bacterium]